MSALTQQLEQLKKQQGVLENIIKKQEERIKALEEKNQALLDENDSLKQQAHDMHIGYNCYSDKEYFPASKFSQY